MRMRRTKTSLSVTVLIRNVALALTATWLTSAGAAHPSHLSTTEIEWNSTSGRFEVAMRVRISDLEDALSDMKGARIGFESHREIERLIQVYLQQHFSLTFQGDRRMELRWIGVEAELHDVWLFFEVESCSGPENGRPSPDTSENTSVQPAEISSPPAVRTWDELFHTPAPREKAVGTAPPAVRPVKIRNTALLAIQPEQVNVVTLRFGAETQSFAMTAKDVAAVLFGGPVRAPAGTAVSDNQNR